MRHLDSGRKLGRTTEHRWALFRNQVNSLVMKERIETTLPKAKELRPLAEWFVTLGRVKTLAAQRRAFNFSRSREVVQKLFADLSPRFVARPGGYTRIMKLGYRLGDSAPMAVIEFLPGEGAVTSLMEGKSGKRGKKGAKPAKPGKEKKAKIEAKPKKEKALPKEKKGAVGAKAEKSKRPVKEEKKPERKEKKSFFSFFRRKQRGE